MDRQEARDSEGELESALENLPVDLDERVILAFDVPVEFITSDPETQQQIESARKEIKF